jgi:hypothetical protein
MNLRRKREIARDADDFAIVFTSFVFQDPAKRFGEEI